jgi:hypothetical protein
VTALSEPGRRFQLDIMIHWQVTVASDSEVGCAGRVTEPESRRLACSGTAPLPPHFSSQLELLMKARIPARSSGVVASRRQADRPGPAVRSRGRQGPAPGRALPPAGPGASCRFSGEGSPRAGPSSSGGGGGGMYGGRPGRLHRGGGGGPVRQWRREPSGPGRRRRRAGGGQVPEWRSGTGHVSCVSGIV